MTRTPGADFGPNENPGPLDFAMVQDAIDTLIDALAAAALTRGEQCIGIVISTLHGTIGPEMRLCHCSSVATTPDGQPLEPAFVSYLGNELIDAAYQRANDIKEHPIC